MAGILTGKGVNAQRRQTSSSASATEELTDLVTTSAPPMWLRAVVDDVIFDPNVLDDERKKLLEETLTNPELFSRVPRNSIIARIITNAAARRSDHPAIFYPMMSHISMPIKPGEHVWVMFEDPTSSTTSGFWLSRIVEPIDVEDPNFTHADRKFDDRGELTSIEKALKADGLKIDQDKPGFPNGGNTRESFTLEDTLAYEKIEKDAIANKVIKKEPVPRYNKRPADLALAGSNNAMILLGEDRTGPAAEGQGPAAKKPAADAAAFAGTIDIVVGRGRELEDEKKPAKLTAPPVIKNTRDEPETDKATVDNANKLEGDPDFKKDSARVYLSMDTKGDTNFKTTGADLPKVKGGGDPKTFDKGSFIIAKGDHIRIIARQDDDAKGGPINGTIRIIKEGKPDDEGGKGRGAVIIEPDGTVVIDGPHIIIGSAALEKGNGAGEHVYIGRDATEPIVLGNEMKKLLMDYTEDIKKAIADWVKAMGSGWVDTAIAPTPTHNFGNFGIPIPGLILLAGTMKAANTALDLAVTAADTKLDTNVIKTLSKIGKTR